MKINTRIQQLCDNQSKNYLLGIRSSLDPFEDLKHMRTRAITLFLYCVIELVREACVVWLAVLVIRVAMLLTPARQKLSQVPHMLFLSSAAAIYSEGYSASDHAQTRPDWKRTIQELR